MPKVRTFIAIEIPDSLSEQIADLQEQLKKHNERIKWTRPESIHLTLKFLGDVEENRIDDLAQKLQEGASQFQTFKCPIKNVGAFPNPRRPRVVWVGMEDTDGTLVRLAQNVDDALNSLGFSKENRKFKPHLTIGRVKAAVSRAFTESIQNTEFQSDPIEISEIVIMRSDLKPTGAVYTPLNKIKFGTHKSGG